MASDTEATARAILEAHLISGTAWGRKGKPDTDLDALALQTIAREWMEMREMMNDCRLIYCKDSNASVNLKRKDKWNVWTW